MVITVQGVSYRCIPRSPTWPPAEPEIAIITDPERKPNRSDLDWEVEANLAWHDEDARASRRLRAVRSRLCRNDCRYADLG
ncbi:hypothetical protein CN177_14560 [Sinorhizobium meliloti]|nr:hypothetical protein CN219_21300 [Sinorhizobium meliloti]RVI38423.1 hypothetical protein CN197_04685 [Sinorhizobium meliloti]RVI42179.1 hypothetical protein CN196_22960 [Sinorhizobium meliloti]RVJ25012.1 hypothetical protein CN177_14560 [Sinorhizobium meliloti]RVJ99407.1 hypothetical protein CN170_16200 [Sinorhizobium meliloti]